ncbi:hypothetical protein EJ08DRAFT_695449 [Tothia fuscella]|uniref:Tetratricopeptide repeat protein 15 n=1 Tax=Tothia fuscella TaxID=1048955 RepID=A0A9P4U0D0_9PEZI|nr:hypothetical protein EJ08DRAFT_695449 [Tothia fuscella]
MESLKTPRPKRGHGRSRSGDERRHAAALSPSTKGPLDLDDGDDLVDSKLSTLPPGSPISRSMSSASRTKSTSTTIPSLTGLDDMPEKDFSFLLLPENFRPIPTTAIPQAFLTSPQAAQTGDDLARLISRGQFHAAAIASARELTNLPTPPDPQIVFNLIHTRLACLTLINKACQELAAVESTVLGDLTSSVYRHPMTNAHIVPWDLRVLAVRLQSFGFKDLRRGVMGYYQLAQDARQEIMKDRQDEKSEDGRVWNLRLRDLGIRVASMLVEMGDLEGAASHLRTLEIDPLLDEEDKRRIASMEALVWLQFGDIWAAKRCLLRLQEPRDSAPDLAPRILQSLISIGDGEFAAAGEQLQQLHAEIPADTMISHNYAVCLLYTGRMKEARKVFEKAVDESTEVPFHSLLTNLCTVFELCTERARDLKTQLIERVTAIEPTGSGWERASTDFKLDGVRA